jgi:glycerate 2-kinase
VVGDDIAGIGSGPCSPDASTATQVKAMLEGAGIYDRLSPPMRSVLEQTHKGLHAETPKPRHPAFAHVSCEILLRNADALAAAAARARELGLDVEVVPEPLEGEAAEHGERIARALIERRSHMSAGQRLCVLWGGEPTVTLVPPDAAQPRQGRAPAAQQAAVPPGGRCQELALAAARALGRAGDGASGIGLLAAGTDGRDGSTDAAGAFVDATTWQAIVDAGHDPARRLAAHDSHAALAAVGALLRPGATGTNVMDVVVGLVET